MASTAFASWSPTRLYRVVRVIKGIEAISVIGVIWIVRVVGIIRLIKIMRVFGITRDVRHVRCRMIRPTRDINATTISKTIEVLGLHQVTHSPTHLPRLLAPPPILPSPLSPVS
jgi:hypothetical protein